MLDLIKKLMDKDLTNPEAWEKLRREKEKELIAHIQKLYKNVKND
jgi:hypothetical protein